MPHYDLWTMELDGSELTNLTQTASASEYEPAVSPDGTQVAYIQLGNADPADDGVYVMSIHGGLQHQVAGRLDYGNGTVFAPVWTGTDQVAFSVEIDAASTAVYMVNTDGGTGSPVFGMDVLGEGWGAATDISPQLDRFVVAAQVGGSAPAFDIYTIGTDGANPQLVYADPQDDHRDPVAKWSPTGEQIAFSHWYTPHANQNPEHMGVATIGIDGSGFQMLTEPTEFCHLQDWSPDGSQILFYKMDTYGSPGPNSGSSQGSFWVMDRDGQNRRQLAVFDEGFLPMEYGFGSGTGGPRRMQSGTARRMPSCPIGSSRTTRGRRPPDWRTRTESIHS